MGPVNLLDPLTLAGKRRRHFTIATTAFGILSICRSAHADCSSGNAQILRDRIGATLRVGQGEQYATISSAAKAARSGDTIEILPGRYPGDVAVWTQDDLIIRGIGERPMLVADGRDAEGKAIFVTRGRRISISNLEFRGARVRDRNGAGIRIERGPVKIVDCRFEDNENGILAGNDPTMEIDILDSVFVGNGAGDGGSHNLYVGTGKRLTVTGSYFARSRVGHLLKSRASESIITYCRLTGEDGNGSYELEFPNGGRVLVLGNLIQQGPRTENYTVISYGAEGYRESGNSLTLAFNTIVNDRPRGGVFIAVRAGADHAEVANNLLVGPGTMAIDSPHILRNNVNAKPDAFVDTRRLDYRLRVTSPIAGRAGVWGTIEGPRPTREFRYPTGSCELQRPSSLTPLSPGAFQRLAS